MGIGFSIVSVAGQMIAARRRRGYYKKQDTMLRETSTSPITLARNLLHFALPSEALACPKILRPSRVYWISELSSATWIMWIWTNLNGLRTCYGIMMPLTLLNLFPAQNQPSATLSSTSTCSSKWICFCHLQINLGHGRILGVRQDHQERHYVHSCLWWRADSTFDASRRSYAGFIADLYFPQKVALMDLVSA
jgi:hypothetical protein